MTIIRTNPLFVAASAWASRFVIAGVQLLGIRYLLTTLGTEAYSAFVLLASLAAWSALADMGIGYSLQNYISETRANKQNASIWITSAALISTPILLISTLLLYYISPDISIVYLSSISYLSEYEKNLVFGTTALLFISTSLGSMAYKVWYANQTGWLSNIFPAFGAAIGLFNIIFFNVSTFKIPLMAAILLYFGPQGLLAVGSLGFIWLKNKKSLLIKSEINYTKSLIKRGWGFWSFTFLSTLVLQADYLVMSQKLNSEYIVTYSILQKIFGLAFFVYSSLLLALWPVCAELNASNNWNELKKYSTRYIWIGIAWVIIFTLTFKIFSREFLQILNFKGNIHDSTIYLLGIYFIVRVWTDTYAMLLQSMNIIKPLWYLVSAQAIISISLQWRWAESGGINGLLIGLISSYLLTVAIGLPLVFYTRIKSTSKI
jgi:O-antigen/teichoic acid export membrane protein